MSGLTELNKAETTAKHGEEQDRRYNDLTEEQLPLCESLKDTVARALPFWNDEIVPRGYVRGGYHGAEPSHRNPHTVRAGQEPETCEVHAVPQG
ncbi:hypothetical protein Q7C36_022176 [Tachysurus vachellii]|uniref:Uncharacterized protein n=1 Tax=Tachysurus vachellii TaxID=175792 RepID=A0AA88LIF3_TACVA|nr:hypothetical protein Q7C36_022176 [Tachysurus vachellii]